MFVNIGAIRTGLGDLLAAARGGGVSKIVLLSFTTIRDGGEQVYALGTQHKMAEDVETAQHGAVQAAQRAGQALLPAGDAAAGEPGQVGQVGHEIPFPLGSGRAA